MITEDTVLLLLKYLAVQDYVRLMSTCRKYLSDTFGSVSLVVFFHYCYVMKLIHQAIKQNNIIFINHLFQNNFFWAQLCNNFVQTPYSAIDFLNLMMRDQGMMHGHSMMDQPVVLHTSMVARSPNVLQHSSIIPNNQTPYGLPPDFTYQQLMPQSQYVQNQPMQGQFVQGQQGTMGYQPSIVVSFQPSTPTQDIVQPMTQSMSSMLMLMRTLYPKDVNHLLQSVQSGRKFMVDGRPLDLCKEINTLNKHLVNHFNFKEEIKRYYFQVILAVLLSYQLQSISYHTNARVTVRLETSIDPKKYWPEDDVKRNDCVSDYIFAVDLAVSPASLKIFSGVSLPRIYKNRLVVYKKSSNQAGTEFFVSRTGLPNPRQFPIPNIPRDQFPPHVLTLLTAPEYYLFTKNKLKL